MSIGFSIEPFESGGPPEAVVPVVDGVALTDRIHAFELAAGMETTWASRYGGLPVGVRLGPASEYYLGRAASLREPGRVPLLGCTCGDVGCHPLFAHIDAGIDVVRWVNFEQPYNPQRDYSAFGPFVFERAQGVVRPSGQTSTHPRSTDEGPEHRARATSVQ